MKIEMIKNTGKQHVIRYIRDDGSITWMHASDFFIRHDLSHYAIESILGYAKAFNGMLNNGMDIRDFEDREKRLQMQVTAEAWYAENMANLFLVELEHGNFEDFNVVQQNAFRTFNQADKLLDISGSEVTAIRDYLHTLLTRWNELPEGEILELNFDL